MSRKAERKRLAARLEKALEEGIRHAKGELDLRTIEIPEEPPELDAKTVTALRKKANMSPDPWHASGCRLSDGGNVCENMAARIVPLVVGCGAARQ